MEASSPGQPGRKPWEARPEAGTRRRRAASFAALAGFHLLLGVILTAPLARHFADGIPYSRFAGSTGAVQHNMPGDNLQLYYRLWLLGDTIAGDSAAFRNRYEFSTAPGVEPPLAAYFTPFSLIFALFSPFGRAAGYNAAVLSSFLLSGLAMHLLVLRYTGDRLAALVAGAAFAAAPYRTMSVLSGHPSGFALSLLPLFILAVEETLARRSIRWAVAAGLLFLLLVDNDLHVLYLAALIAPLFVLRHFAGRPLRAWSGEIRALLGPALAAAALAAGAVAAKMSLLPAAVTDAPARSLREITLYAPRLADALGRANISQATYAYLGVAALAVALAGLVAEQTRDGRLRMLFFLLLLAGSYLLVFGPRFPVSAPYLFLYRHLPRFAMIRQTSKIMAIAVFALAVLAGLGTAALRRRLPGPRGVFAALLALALLLADGSSYPARGVGVSILPDRVPSYEEAFRGRPGARVVNVPIWPGNDAWSSHYLYYATRYRTVMVNGYHPYPPLGYAEAVFRPLSPLNAGQVGERQYELLRAQEVGHLIFHEESFPPKVSQFPSQFTLDNLSASPYLAPLPGAAPVWVFRVRAPGEVTAREMPLRSSLVGAVTPIRPSAAGEMRDDPEGSGGRSLFAGPGVTDFALARPRTTPAGRFLLAARVRPVGEARFSLSARRTEDDAVLAERSFTEAGDGYRTVTFEFALTEASPVHIRIEKASDCALALDWFHLRFADQADPLEAFEFEQIFHTGNTGPHPAASGGRALRLTPDDPAGQATRGPYRLYDAGSYAITVSLARDGGEDLPPDTPVASLILRNHLDESGEERDRAPNVLMAERTIAAGEFAGQAGFTDFTFPYTLRQPTFLSVNLQHFGRGLYADRASIRRVDP